MSKLPPLPPGSKRAYWICQCVGWYGYALLQIAAIVAFTKIPAFSQTLAPEMLAQFPQWPRATVELLGLGTGGILLSHLLRGLIKRYRWDLLGWPRLIAKVFAAGLVFSAPLGLSQHFMAVSVMNGTGSTTDEMPAWIVWPQIAIQWAPLFWLWMAIYLSVLNGRKRRHAELRQSELARELQAAQLRLLKAQVNPHFLFNSLNSVRALISEDTAAATRAVTQLARTLRYSLASGDPPELVTLEQELETVADYLELEALRLGERLHIERDIEAAALRARIPVMLVQTLVENAIKHGIAELPQGGALRISARVRDGVLRLEIENPRPRVATRREGEGVGLRNGTERLRLLFGDEASLDLDLGAADRAVARLRVPAGR
jgi:hypothetical protein